MSEHQTGHPAQSLAERSTSKEKGQTVLAGTTLTLLLLFLGIQYPSAFARLNNVVSDWQIGLLGKTGLSSSVFIVQVDEESLAAYGQWPWPRYQVANLLKAIQSAGASAVGIDALFVENDRTSPAEIKKTMEKDLKQPFPISAIPQNYWDYDTILGETLKQGPFIASYFFTFNSHGANPCQPKSASGAVLANDGQPNPSQHLYKASNLACNVGSIQQGALASGFINSAPDNDGVYRKTPLIISYQGRLFPSLALQTYMTANKLDNFILATTESGLVLRLGETNVPLDNAGNLLIKFPAHGQQLEKVSAKAVLSGKTKPMQLKDKIVFLGFSAAGLHEFRPTPYEPQFLGVELHGAVVDNLLRKNFLQRLSNAQALELIAASLLGLALIFGLAGAGPTAIVTVPLGVIALLFLASQWLLANSGIVFSPALPVLMAALALILLALMKYVREFLHAQNMTKLVALTQEGIIGGFCSMSEYRDPETGAHIKRTQFYVKALAQQLRHHPDFKLVLTKETIELMFKAAPLHDIGKIGIRDHILLKAGSLAADEFEIMKQHPKMGGDMVRSVANQIGWNPFMRVAYDIALYHQEKWDGSGYPNGLAGEAIPLAARLMALADVYDALISKRVYKPAFSHDKATGIILDGKNSHFDPRVVEAFATINLDFRNIALQFLDSAEQKDTLLATSETKPATS